MHLILPDKYESITVKIVGKVYKMGDKVKKFFVPVRLFGDTIHSRIFEMEIKKTLFQSLDNELLMREELGSLGGNSDENPDLYRIDDDYECLIGKVMTVTGIPDTDRSFETKGEGEGGGGGGKIDNPKIFQVQLRDDLEEIERIGGEQFTKKTREELGACALRNLKIIKEKDNKEVEWVKKKREREEKAKKELKKLDGGW